MSESRPLFISHALATTLGAVWLTLVYTLPSPPPSIALLRPEEAAAVEVQFEDEAPKPVTTKADEPPAAKEPTRTEKAKAAKEEQAMADAFGGASAPVGDVANALRAVQVTRGGGGSEGGGKAVLSYGAGGAAVRTPGRGLDASVTAAGAGIGRVNAAGSVNRASLVVAAPTIVRSGDGGASGRDMARLGTFVRARQAQLQYCYADAGLAANPALAGSVSVTVTLDASGAVREGRVTNRTWSGAGVVETEACILQRVRTWAFPPSASGGAESYGFSFIFNR